MYVNFQEFVEFVIQTVIWVKIWADGQVAQFMLAIFLVTFAWEKLRIFFIRYVSWWNWVTFLKIIVLLVLFSCLNTQLHTRRKQVDLQKWEFGMWIFWYLQYQINLSMATRKSV